MSFAAEKLILQSCKSQVVAAVCTIFPQPVPPSTLQRQSCHSSTVFQTVAATRQSPGTRSPITVEMGQLYEGRGQN